MIRRALLSIKYVSLKVFKSSADRDFGYRIGNLASLVQVPDRRVTKNGEAKAAGGLATQSLRVSCPSQVYWVFGG